MILLVVSSLEYTNFAFRNRETEHVPYFPEEILSSNSAIWFSPDARRLAYIQFNDSSVEEVQLPLYEPSGSSPYTRYGSLRYPKAGTANPEVTLFVVDMRSLENEQTYRIQPPQVFSKR